MKLLTQTNTGLLSLGILLLRWITGLILFVAGAGKAFAWFGGFGMKMTLHYFKTGSNIPASLAYLSTYAELIGGALLIIGFLTRPAAFALTINMLVAVLVTGFTNFFMGGAAYPACLMFCCLTILLAGPMRYSVDALLFNRNAPIITA